MPVELTPVVITALVAVLLLILIVASGWRPFSGWGTAPDGVSDASHAMTTVGASAGAARVGGNGHRDPGAIGRGGSGSEATLRFVWWLSFSIVALGAGISGSFEGQSPPIFVLAAGAVVAVVVFHEVPGIHRTGIVRFAELVTAVALVSGLLALTGFASSPFSMLFALVAVAAALAYGPRAGLAAAVLATISFAALLVADPQLTSYTPSDALRLSVGLIATWLLAFVAVAYAARQRSAIAAVLTVSRTDPLTGLFNRSQLFATLELEVSRTRRSDRGFCVLMIDLDGLKAVNDSMGHLRGDDVLRALGNVIHHSIRTVDSAYRYGGDEFVVLLPETDIVGAFVVAEKIRAGSEDLAMNLAATLGGPEPVTSVSIGLVSHPEDGLSAEELMTAADRAMYQAKKLGKNQISGNPRARPALIARRSTISPRADTPREPRPQADLAAARQAPLPASTAPLEDRAVAVELGPIAEPADPSAADAGNSHDEDEDQADAGEVRRQIAAASRSFDPDHQIRRAMDAFLSPLAPDTERPTPDH